MLLLKLKCGIIHNGSVSALCGNLCKICFMTKPEAFQQTHKSKF